MYISLRGQHGLPNRYRPSLAGLAIVLLLAESTVAQDQFMFYFPGSTAGVGNLGGTTFDAEGNFWVITQRAFLGPTPVSRLNKVELLDGVWTKQDYVTDQDLAFFYRSSDIEAGVTNPLWGGPQFGTPASFLLNPRRSPSRCRPAWGERK